MLLRKSDLKKGNNFQFIIFGGTGDLAHRKLIPAFYNLLDRDLSGEDFSVIGIGRRSENREEYLNSLYSSLEEALSGKVKEDVWDKLKQRVDYIKADFKESRTYEDLKDYLNKIDDKGEGDRIFYLAVAPNFFDLIVDKLDEYDLATSSGKGWRRLVIEKPFGHDLESAKRLNKRITQVFSEENIYRIDHYLGKEMLQSILVIRFANLLFEPIWNNRYIDNVQIISTEPYGVKDRGRYYEKAGALKDMVQNHMFQILSLIAMEPPAQMETKDIRDEKVKILKSLIEGEDGEVDSWAIRGQYGEGEIRGEKVISYRDEDRVDNSSNTDTFAALKVLVDNLRWSGVPFYIKTGKRLPEKVTKVIIEFKSDFHPAFLKGDEPRPNLLVIKVQPEEGVYLQFNAKEPGSDAQIIPVKMDFCQNCQVGLNSPEAYERLIHNVILGDQTLFTRWDEVEYAWRFIDKIADYWNENKGDFPNYRAGSVGPEESKELLEMEGRRWWD